jgi:hypothetical protein
MKATRGCVAHSPSVPCTSRAPGVGDSVRALTSSSEIPMGGLPAALGTAKDIYARLVMEAVFPQSRNRALNDAMKVRRAVPVRSPRRELFATPCSQEDHGLLTAELPLLALDRAVGRRSDELEEQRARDARTNPALVVRSSQFEVVPLQPWNSVGESESRLRPRNGPEYRVLYDSDPARTKAGTARQDSLRTIGVRDDRAAIRASR